MVPRMMALALALALAAAGAGGCASATPGQKTVEGFQQMQAAVVQAQGTVEGTLASLNHLRYTGEMAGMGSAGGAEINDAFGGYKKTVAALETEGASARRRAEALKENVDANILAWEKELKGIENPSIKASVQGRRDAIRANYKLVRMYADDARKAYEPFLRDNKDIVQALSIDLSPAALAGLKPALAGAMGKGEALQQRLVALQHALGNIERGVGPIGIDGSPAPAPARSPSPSP
jgi:hypothetical protein